MKFREYMKAALVGASLLGLIGGPALAQQFTLPDGSTLQGHLRAATQAGAAPPTLTGATVNAGSTDAFGSFTATAASGSMTFARTYGTAPFVLIVDASATSTVSMPVYTVSPTAVTLSTIISTHVYYYVVIGQQSSS